MVRLTKFVLILCISIVLLILLVIGTMVMNSPYYSGFESELSYLSPDLSENRTIIRDNFYLSGKSEVKIVFEKKNSFISYDREQFNSFIKDLELQIWNNNEYFSFLDSGLSFFNDTSAAIEIPVGELKGNGRYNIYINSDFAVNPTYHIGIGIGKESGFKPIGNNRRNFY